jgi:putative sterol carrier protein
MAVVYPSMDWLNELKRVVNSDETLRKAAANWEGDFLCVVEMDQEALNDFQKPKVLRGLASLLAAIPKDKRAAFKGTPVEKFVQKLGVALEDIDPSKLDIVNFEELARRVAGIKLDEIKGASLYIWLDLWHGEMREARPVAPGEVPSPRFTLTGPYAAFKEVVTGKVDVTTQIVRGKLKLRGDLGYILRNAAAVTRFGKLMASIPIEA